MRLLARTPSPREALPLAVVLGLVLPFYGLAALGNGPEATRLGLPLLGFLLPRWALLRAARFAAAACTDEALVLAVPAWRRGAAVVALAGLWPVGMALLPGDWLLVAVVLAALCAGAGLGARSPSVGAAVWRASWWSFLPALVALLGLLLARVFPVPALAVACMASPTLLLMISGTGRVEGWLLHLGGAMIALWAAGPWLLARPRGGDDLPDVRTVHLLAGLVCTALFVTTVGPVRAGCGSLSTRCRNNLRNVGTALEMYADDFGGSYPARLSQLVPGYLKALPTCPSAGRETYSDDFESTRRTCTVVCSGQHHRDLPANYPQYRSTEGLAER